MAIGQKWYDTTRIRLRDKIVAHGHAMPIGLVPQSNIEVFIGFTVLFAQGRSVPISRGSPPISDG